MSLKPRYTKFGSPHPGQIGLMERPSYKQLRYSSIAHFGPSWTLELKTVRFFPLYLARDLMNVAGYVVSIRLEPSSMLA
jgi:hypothetical protein